MPELFTVAIDFLISERGDNTNLFIKNWIVTIENANKKIYEKNRPEERVLEMACVSGVFVRSKPIYRFLFESIIILLETSQLVWVLRSKQNK
ncbi:MAG: hypothetical protein ACXVCP_15900 [Bdellovibrio sp.]